MSNVVDPVPSALVESIVIDVVVVTASRVPEITPVVVFNVSPVGNVPADNVQPVGTPPVLVGVSVAVPSVNNVNGAPA